MEKKEMFFKIMNDYHSRLKEYVKNGDLEKDENPDEWLWKSVEQELDKVREEVVEEIIKQYGDYTDAPITEEIQYTTLEEALEEMLSKLKDNK
jgi:hypothetical protein